MAPDPILSVTTIGEITFAVGNTFTVDPTADTTTIIPVSWISSPATWLIPPLQEHTSIGQTRWIQHTTPVLGAPISSNYNGTTYEVIMSGGHAGLPDILIPTTQISAEEGGVKVEEKIVVLTPGGNPNMTTRGGLLGATDYGADTPQNADTSAIGGASIDSVALIDDATTNVYSTAFASGSQKILGHKITGSSTKFTGMYPFTGPRISQLRAVPGQGFVAVTLGGIWLIGDPADPSTHHARNSGITSPGGGRLSLLADGSLIVYLSGDMRLWKTADLGVTWTSAQGDLLVGSQLPRDIYVASATHWYVVTSQAIWKTTNAGVTWIGAVGDLALQVGPTQWEGGLLSVHGVPGSPHTAVVGGAGYGARTTNGGATWFVFGPTEGMGVKPARYRVHQAGAVLLGAYGEFYEQSPAGYVWRSEDNGVSSTAVFMGTATSHANDIASAFGFVSDLVVITTPKSEPGTEDKPWVPTDIGTKISLNRSSLLTVSAQVDSVLLSAIAARMLTVGGKKARFIVRQVQDYRTQKYYQTIASGAYQSIESSNSSLSGLVNITITARDTNIKQPWHQDKVARVIPDTNTVVGLEGEGADITLSMLIDETILPGAKISWLGTEYTVSGIKYAISDSSRLMSLNTAVRVFAVPTSDARAGISKVFPRYTPPRATAKRSRV